MFCLTKKSVFSGLLVTACSLGVGAPAFAEPAAEAVNQIAEAMGGVALLQAANNQHVTGRITTYMPLQAPIPGGEPEKQEGIEFALLRGLDGERYSAQWTLDLNFPLQAHYDFTETINGDHGSVEGVDTLLQVPQAPMQSIRLGARKVQHLVMSPVELVKTMMTSPADVTIHGSHERRHRDFTVLSINRYGKEILLWVNNRSHLPEKVAHWDSNPSYGDSKIITRFSNWQDAGGIMVPMKVEQSYKDDVLLKEERQEVSFNLVFFQDPFAIRPELTVPLDEHAYDIGLKYSNMFFRYLLVGIPFDLNQYVSESVFLQPVADGVYYLRAFSHHSLIVEMKNYLVVFDPVLLEERTQQVLPVIKAQWPDKEIKYVVPTHFHLDHSGGVRGYVADGAKLITIESSKKFFKKVLKAEHEIYPDMLSLIHNRAKVIDIDDDEEFVLDDGQRRIRFLQIDNRHAPGLIVPYIEDVKMIFTSDLFSPDLLPVPNPPQFSYWALDLYNDLVPRGLDIETIVGAHGGVGSYQSFLDAVEGTFDLP